MTTRILEAAGEIRRRRMTEVMVEKRDGAFDPELAAQGFLDMARARPA